MSRMVSLQKSTVDGIDLLTILRPGVTKTVMLLHGYGANYEDLAPLAQELDPDRKWNWVFPNGIMEVPFGPHMSGRAWFPIRMAEIEAAAMRNETIDFADTLPTGMRESQERLESLIQSLRIHPSGLVLGGFSQGAMMTVQVAIHLPSPLRGMILFSGTLINRVEWSQKLPAMHEIPYIQSHGKMDQLLGYSHAARLHQTLKDSGFIGEFIDFSGGHEIPLPVIRKAATFLAARL